MRNLGHRSSESLIALLAALVALQLAGCRCGSDEKASTKSTTTPSEPAEVKLPVNVQPDLLEELKAAAASCEVAKGQQGISCNGSEKNALILAFNKGERKRIPALPTFVHAMTADDPKLKALSAAVLYASFRTGFGAEAKTGSVKPDVADQLLEAALSLPDSSSMQAIPAATHASMLSGQGAKLDASLTQEVPIQVRTMAYRYMMVYGRLPAFQKVREFAKDPGAAVVLAAIESPRNMSSWTEEEQEAICPWAETFVDDSRPAVAGNALAALSNCGGKHIDTLLSGVEKAAREKQFSFIHATALRELCGATNRGSNAASEAQCSRLRTLQEKVVKDSAVQGRVRAMTLSTMANSFADERTLTFAKKLTSSDSTEVATSAQQIATRLSAQKGAPPKSPWRSVGTP